ncbi:MAG: hypothetical protein NZ516_08400 [Raineya sp.]|nr:hypothetical protein [Raineya sp.]
MRTVVNFLNIVSNLAFAVLLIAFVLKNFQNLSTDTFQMLSLIAWGTLAVATFFEGFLYKGQNKFLILLATFASTATIFLILSKIMFWKGFEKLEYAPYVAAGLAVLLIFAQKGLTNLNAKFLIISILGLLIVMGKL